MSASATSKSKSVWGFGRRRRSCRLSSSSCLRAGISPGGQGPARSSSIRINTRRSRSKCGNDLAARGIPDDGAERNVAHRSSREGSRPYNWEVASTRGASFGGGLPRSRMEPTGIEPVTSCLQSARTRPSGPSGSGPAGGVARVSGADRRQLPLHAQPPRDRGVAFWRPLCPVGAVGIDAFEVRIVIEWRWGRSG